MLHSLLPLSRQAPCYHFHRGRQKRGRQPTLGCRVGSSDPLRSFSPVAPGTVMVQLVQHKADRPAFHVAPKAGWINDPNGPLYFGGKFHLFYQHVIGSSEWSFGLVWGHAVSSDLVHWEHLPEALVPSHGGPDADGCFSGCAVVDRDGTPTILYTGVRLRSNADCGPLPPPEFDLHLPFVETQIVAVADPSDPDLVRWTKHEAPFLPLPPAANMNLSGWRDPFIIERPSPESNDEWVMCIGSGIKSQGGTVVVYRSASLTSGWQYDGMLAQGDGDTGSVWECPLIVRLHPATPKVQGSPLHTLGLRQQMHGGGSFRPTHQQQQQQMQVLLPHQPLDPQDLTAAAGSGGSSTPAKSPIARSAFAAGAAPLAGFDVAATDARYSHFFCISPDACTNPTIYWLGQYAGGRFNLAEAKGPFRLDLGDILYAPNVTEDDKGRTLLWGWLQERRSVGTYDYAGCLSIPRILKLDYDRLFQEPLPELVDLRSGESHRELDVLLLPEQPLPLPQVGGPFLDLDVTFRQGTAPTVGILLKSWNASGEGGAAVLYNWESNTLEVVFEALDPATVTFSLTAPTARTIGGNIDMKPGQPLQLRMLIDYSCVEIFTGSGEVLTTRMYRGTPPPGSDAGIEFVAFDGTATLARVEAYEMTSIWREEAAKMYESAGEAAAAAAAASSLGTALSEKLLLSRPGSTSLEGLEVMGEAGGLGADLLDAEALADAAEESGAGLDLFMEVMA